MLTGPITIRQKLSSTIIEENWSPLVRIAPTLQIVLCSIEKSLGLRRKAIFHFSRAKRTPLSEKTSLLNYLFFIQTLLVSLSPCAVPQNCLRPFSDSHLKLNRNCEYVMCQGGCAHWNLNGFVGLSIYN